VDEWELKEDHSKLDEKVTKRLLEKSRSSRGGRFQIPPFLEKEQCPQQGPKNLALIPWKKRNVTKRVPVERLKPFSRT